MAERITARASLLKTTILATGLGLGAFAGTFTVGARDVVQHLPDVPPEATRLTGDAEETVAGRFVEAAVPDDQCELWWYEPGAHCRCRNGRADIRVDLAQEDCDGTLHKSGDEVSRLARAAE